MKKNVVSLVGILAVMSLTACSNKPEASGRVTQDLQAEQKAIEAEQETETIADDLPVQKDGISQSETTAAESYNQGTKQIEAVSNSPQNSEETDGMDSDKKEDTAFINFEVLGIKEYEYPSEFIMGDNLKTALAQLACGYSSFDSDTPIVGDWKQYFIASYIQNSRLTFDYLDLISEQNDGLISIEELNYIQYSLTNTELDFSGFASYDIIRYEAASPFRSGSISGYDYEDTDNGVLITADLEVRYDGAEDVQKYKITAELVRNPYSCFDGYSIVALSSTIADDMQGDAIFDGEY